MRGILLALLLAIPARAQEGAILVDRFFGINDTQSPASLSNSQAQDALNVESNRDGTAIVKRPGFSREASLTYTTAPVTGSAFFITDAGDRLTVVCHDRHCSKSTNGSQFSNWLSTAGGSGLVPTRWSFVAVDGDLYGANDKRDNIIKYDGSSLSYTTAPAGSLLELTEDRLVIADPSDYPNRVWYSRSGDYLDFTLGGEEFDAWWDDIGAPGDKVNGLKYCNGNLYIFKLTSITECQLGDQYTTICSGRSSIIGTNDPMSLVCAPDGLYFKAQDRTYWQLTSNDLIPISQEITNFTKNQVTGAARSNTQTTQADWQNGSQSPSSSWDTSTTAGSIFPSSITRIDTSSSDFAGGSLNALVVTDLSGSLTLSSITFRDSFGDGNYTANPTWTAPLGGWAVTSNVLKVNGVGSDRIYTPQTISTGVFQATIYTCGVSDSINMKFVATDTVNQQGSAGYALNVARDSNGDVVGKIVKYPSGAAICTGSTVSNGTYVWKVTRSSNGVMDLFRNGTFDCTGTDTDYNTSSTLMLWGADNCGVDDISFYSYLSSGSFVSRVFDMTFSTPTGGPFTLSTTVPSGTALSFQIHSASSSSGAWSAYAAISSGTRITDTKRYFQYISSFTTTNTTATPSIEQVNLPALTTGQFRTQCIQPGTGASSWGIVSCAETKVGAGNLVYYATSAATCATLPSGDPTTWQTSITNNATLGITVNAALYIGVRSLSGSTTDQAQLDACTLYWNQGTVAQPVWGVYDGIKNAIYWTGTSTAATQGDRVLKYDLNLRQFYPFNLQATALSYIDNNVYFGSSNGGYWNRYATPGVNSDNGSDINAYWKSKDFAGASPFNETSFDRVSLVARNQTTGNMTITHTMSNSQTSSHLVSLSTASTNQYIRDNYRLPLASPQNFINFSLGNVSQTPFEVLGLGIYFNTKEWRPVNP